MKVWERAQGAMFGLAVGDAVGTTLEFQPPGSFTPLTDMVGGGPFHLKPGEWTDDTSMALCLAQSLIEQGGFDAADQMQKYLRWRDEGYFSVKDHCFDIGGTVSAALERFRRTGEAYAGSTDPRTAGNGSIMRLAPVPIAYLHDPAAAIAFCVESSRTTHQAPAALDACRYFGGLLVGALLGVSKDDLLSAGYSPVSDTFKRHPLGPEIGAIAAGSFKDKQPPAIRGTGYVVDSLEAALWAFYRSETFEDGCLLAVNLGHDADTTGAVYGQLAGAYYGRAGIPERWRKAIAMASTIYAMTDALLDVSRWMRDPESFEL